MRYKFDFQTERKNIIIKLISYVFSLTNRIVQRETKEGMMMIETTRIEKIMTQVNKINTQ